MTTTEPKQYTLTDAIFAVAGMIILAGLIFAGMHFTVPN
jgi:hypothetical protein